MTAVLSSDPPSSAAGADLASVDQVDQSFRISVTNGKTHVDYPATLLVQGATLTTSDPSDSGASAPENSSYLTLEMSSEPVQNQFGDPTWGDFYSNMTPLPATALRYVTASGRSYVSTRIDVNTQASFANADGDDGLVDATYYFTIPIADLTGTLEILPSRTSGMRYENFKGVGTTTLVTGGPVRDRPASSKAGRRCQRRRHRSRSPDQPPCSVHDVRQHAQLRVDDSWVAPVGRLSISGFVARGVDSF